ncbi:CPBP family intramembrane glutamic endopeptidase [Pseudomonas caspiana]|uniref:CPBP family intramembrane glutamic endopeptidase n=1 Tax=Pseudomonas caspiana TaxID=1451454 RepID=UPI0032EE3E95
MPAIRWTSLTLLTLGYCIALSFGYLSLPAAVTFGLLVMAGICVTQSSQRVVICFGHGLFIILALALAIHWLPGFFSERVIAAQRFSPEAAPFSMYFNLDKPLTGFWVLLVCPWLLPAIPAQQALKTAVLTLLGTSAVCMTLAVLLGVTGWSPKWPAQSTLWLLNNLLLVTLTEELFFRVYLQGGLQRLLQRLPYASALALCIASLLFGLAHLGGGWQWALLAGIAGMGYGLAYRFGGLQAAVATHFGLNLVHFSLFAYPMFDR